MEEVLRFSYILGFVNALFFSILIFSKKEKSTADRVLGVWFIMLGLQLFWPFLYLSDIESFISFIGLEAMIFPLHPIFLFVYIKILTGTRMSRQQILFSFWPMILIVPSFYPFLTISNSNRIKILEGEYLPVELFPGFIIVLLAMVWYVARSFLILKKHKNQTLHIFSYRDNVDLLWLRRLLVTFTLIYILVLPIGIILYSLGYSLAYSDFIFYMALAGLIFCMGYWGYKQGTIFSANQASLPTLEKTMASDKAEQNYSVEAQSLKQVMEKEKPYLDATLTIHQLATQVNLPSHVVSKVLRKSLNKTFFEFINHYRIEHFKKLAAMPRYKNFTLLGIALECGFNSKSAFNRIFKEQTGQTPGEFKKTQS